MGLLHAKSTKNREHKGMFPSKIPSKINPLTSNLSLRTRQCRKGLTKEDSQTILKKAFLIEVALEVLGPTETFLLVCKQSRLGTSITLHEHVTK